MIIHKSRGVKSPLPGSDLTECWARDVTGGQQAVQMLAGGGGRHQTKLAQRELLQALPVTATL